MTVIEAYESFNLSKKLAGLTDASLKDYYYCLKGFISYAGNDTNTSLLDESLVNAYILSLHQSALSRSTVATYIRNLQIFLRYIADNWGLPFSPETIKVPKSPKKKLRVYSSEDVVLIFNTCQTSVPWITARNRAVIALMLDSGLRLKEVASLRLEDISFTDKRLKVYGKGDKERYTLLGDVSVRYLRQYIDLCPYPVSGYVFLSDNGTPLTKSGIQTFVTRLADKLPFPLSCHVLRHNFATNYCIMKAEHGEQIDAYTLKTLMGHSSISTTEGYIHCALELLAVKSSSSYLSTVSGLP
ncbi:MAG TPA: tyrosine-type recombinase/integrase [Firmicutes bacterium]|nr:tyrosine-type recombinase/integrase [Bacillota bacterium]